MQKRLSSFFVNTSMLVVSLLLALAAVEIFLRIDGRYSDLVIVSEKHPGQHLAAC
jgi:hypothetical protein